MAPLNENQAASFGSVPHGGRLVNRLLAPEETKDWTREAKSLKSVVLTDREISDVEMITNGGFSPLEGFMVQKDYKSVVKEMRLSTGQIWSIPVTLSVSNEEASGLTEDRPVALLDKEKELL